MIVILNVVKNLNTSNGCKEMFRSASHDFLRTRHN